MLFLIYFREGERESRQKLKAEFVVTRDVPVFQSNTNSCADQANTRTLSGWLQSVWAVSYVLFLSMAWQNHMFPANLYLEKNKALFFFLSSLFHYPTSNDVFGAINTKRIQSPWGSFWLCWGFSLTELSVVTCGNRSRLQFVNHARW